MRARTTSWAALLVIAAPLFTLLYIACSADTPHSNVCFADHVVPLVRSDCAPCHGNGEYDVELQGDPGDLEELERYISPFDPDDSLLLDWAEGRDDHPPLWTSGSEARATMEAWIAQGGGEVCFNHDRFGQCRFDEDCPENFCRCDDGESVVARACAVDLDTQVGTCAWRDNCTEARFELCAVEADGDADADGDGDVDADADGDLDADADGGGEISFSDDIVPLLRFDCARCHSMGQWGVRIRGDVSDYDVVMNYVNVDAPEEENGFLWWAAGGGLHPISWPPSGTAYNLFLDWVEQGALNN